MTLYLPGLAPDTDLADDVGFGSVPEARATLAQLGVSFSDWPGLRGFALLVAGRAYRLHVHHHGGPALFELARTDAGTLQSVASWHGQREILGHLGAELRREQEVKLGAMRGRVLACYDETGRQVELDDELLGRITRALTCAA